MILLTRLLHISDIHFKSPACLLPHQDRDAVIRDLLLEDIDKIRVSDGIKVDAVLISGDIAFAAKAEEYRVASQWIDDLCARIKCEPQNVYVVPGNHDVNRASADSPLLSGLRTQLWQKQSTEEREQLIQKMFNDPETLRLLISPMKEYNDFASRYNCEVTVDSPFWEESIPISETVNLSLRGITSTFFSSKDDSLGRLQLGTNQTVFRHKKGVIQLTMMHHPIDWYCDSDFIEDQLCNGANIQLMGHKHKARWSQGDEYVRIAANAIHPDRGEGQYEPGYNLIDLEHIEEDKQHHVEIKTQVRIMQLNPNLFVSKQTRGGKSHFTQKLSVTPLTISIKNKNDESVNKEAYIESIIEPIQESKINPRELMYEFWKLSSSTKRKIINDLDLLTDNEWDHPEAERQKKAFEAANKSNQIKELAELTYTFGEKRNG